MILGFLCYILLILLSPADSLASHLHSHKATCVIKDTSNSITPCWSSATLPNRPLFFCLVLILSILKPEPGLFIMNSFILYGLELEMKWTSDFAPNLAWLSCLLNNGHVCACNECLRRHPCGNLKEIARNFYLVIWKQHACCLRQARNFYWIC